MDEDLKRWRRLGHGNIELISAQIGANLVPKKSKKVSISPVRQHQKIQRQQQHVPSEDKLFLHSILEKLSTDQKKDQSTIWSGHLNHDNLNKRLVRPLKIIRSGGGNVSKVAAKSKTLKSPYQPSNTLPSAADAVMNSQKSAKADKSGVEKKQEDMSRSDLAHVSPPPNMHDLLEQFDSVKLGRKEDKKNNSAEDDTVQVNFGEDTIQSNTCEVRFTHNGDKKSEAHLQRSFVPAYQFSVTKAGQYDMLKSVDQCLVESEWTHKTMNHSQAERVQAIYNLLQQELRNNDCPPEGPDLKRLKVYQMIFDKVIAEFKSFGPVLAEIKKEYDSIVNNNFLDQNELGFLRAKVRKLLAQNENRLLLKYERKRSLELETKLHDLHDENEKLKEELKRKLALYASYLPASAMYERRKDDPLLVEIMPSIKSYPVGEDPITTYENQIKFLSSETATQAEEIIKLKMAQEQEFVPKSAKEKIELELIDTESKFEKMKIYSEELERDLKEKINTVSKLESALREREEQYHFLIAEYTGLTESLNKT